MVATTTWGTVRNNLITVVQAITPSLLNRPENLFRRCPDKSMSVDQWAITHAADTCFRRFDVRRAGQWQDPEVLDPTAIRRQMPAMITVAYPVNVALYGADDLDDLENLVDSDAMQIRDAVFSPDNQVSGQTYTLVTVDDLDRADPRVWFQRFTLEVEFYTTQNL